MGNNHARTMQRLENQVKTLRENVRLLHEIGDLKKATLVNSISGLVSTAFPTSELNSFNALSYNANYAPLTIQWNMLMYLYKTHGVMQAAIDMPVQDAFKGGLEFRSDEFDKDDVGRLEDWIERNEGYATMKQAEIWARLFGGAALILSIEGEDPEKPLDVRRIKGKKIQLFAANRWELTESTGRYADFYNFYGVRIHHTRLITIAGKEAPYTIKWILQGWGMSDFERMIQPLNSFLLQNNVVYDLLKEAKIDVLQFEGFASQLVTEAGTQIALRRVEAANQGKNAGNAILLDTKDKFEQKQITFAGLAEIYKENRIGLCSSIRMPMSKLFGTTAGSGMANSAQDDLENYNGMVESDVRMHAKPMIRWLVDILSWNLFGDEFDVAFSFRPLREIGAVEEEQIKTSKHARYAADVAAGYLTPKEYMDLQQAEGLIQIATEVSKGAEPLRPETDDADLGVEPGEEKGDDDGED